MIRLWNAMKRIWKSTHRITREVVSKIVKETGTALSGFGATAAAILAIVIMATILIIVLAVSLPIGIFTDRRANEVNPTICTQTG